MLQTYIKSATTLSDYYYYIRAGSIGGTGGQLPPPPNEGSGGHPQSNCDIDIQIPYMFKDCSLILNLTKNYDILTIING